jgi:hypothetical protein
MKRFGVAFITGFSLLVNCAQASNLLSKDQALARAIAVLKGDPYGKTAREIASNIKGIELLQNGSTKACGANTTPAWEFHVVVRTPDKNLFQNGVIDGYMALDARTGKLLCGNLPLLD